MYNDIAGTWAYVTGTSGTKTIPSGARVLSVYAHAATGGGATVQIFNGNAIPIPITNSSPGWLVLKMNHGLCVAGNDNTTSGSGDIVFTNTDALFVEYILAGNS